MLLGLAGLQKGDKFIVKPAERVEQGSAPVGGHGVKHQITVGVAKNLYPTGVKPELLGNADRLAVAVHEDPTDSAWHTNPLYTLKCVYF